MLEYFDSFDLQRTSNGGEYREFTRSKFNRTLLNNAY